MGNTTQNPVRLAVRAYPLSEPKSNTVAFASVTINDMIGINGIRVVKGSKGYFAAMPQTKDTKGEYRDIAFPVTKELREQLNKAILDAYSAEVEKGAHEKASVKEQIKEGAASEKEAPAKEAPAAAKGKSGKTAKKSTPEH